MKVLNILEIDYEKYIKSAVNDIAYDANLQGYLAGQKPEIYNTSDEDGSAREQKRKAGISRAIKLMMANRNNNVK